MKAESIASRRCGYTLLEMVVTLPLMSVLIVGAAGAIGIVSRTATDGGASESLVRIAPALEAMTAELECATSVSSRSATSITVVTPDRSGDGIDDTISYSWSGTAGAPLLRTVNGASAAAVASVQSLSLTYRVRNVLGVNYLQGMEVRLSAAAGTTEQVSCVRCLNEPVAP